MSLRYILGKPGTGKTTMCINEIAEIDNMKERVFYIVPEQFTLESEKNLLSKKNSVVNINVLGFRHFAYYLISKMGMSGRVMLDDIGRAMLIKRILLEVKDTLEFYKSAVDKQGFADNLDTTISELMQYSVSEESIEKLISDLDESNLKNKLKDINIIFSKYREYMAKEYIAGDGALEVLCELIPNSMVKNSIVWIDGFKSFTPQENKVIEMLLKYCKKVNISFTISSNKTAYKGVSQFDPEYEVKRAITAVTEIAENNNINIEEVKFLNNGIKVYNEEIEYLKNNYFNYKFKPYNKEVKNIAIYKAKNMYEEIEKVCGEIKKLVQYKGLRYRDIALIIGSESYEVPLSIALKKFNIPNFLDARKNVSSHPLISLITSAVDIIAYGWDNKAVFKFLKTGYTYIDFDSVYTLENYVNENGINKYKWNKEWKYGFKNDERNSGKPEKEEIEKIKNALFEILEPLIENHTAAKKAKVIEITKNLFKVIENLNVTERLEKEIAIDIKRKDNIKTVVDEEIWNTVIDVFNKMADILGDEKISLREYSKILKAGFNTATIGVAPPAQDYIIVGDMERTRLSDIKAMFILGANEGNIPVKLREQGVFNDDEKLVMEDNNIALSPSIMQKTNNGRLGIYLNIIKATDYITFSYPMGSINSESLTPSSIIAKIKAIFPFIEEKEIVQDYNMESILTDKGAAFDKLITAMSLNKESEFIKELYAYYKRDEEYSKKLKAIRYGVFSQLPQSFLDEKLIPMLWNSVLGMGSVSKLEKFTSCPFKFFMEYIIRAKEREVYKIKSNDVGTLAHRIMEEFSKHIALKKMDWEEADKNYTDNFIDDNISAFINEMNTDIFENNRNQAILNKIIKSAKYALWANVEQIKASKFKPENFEISFGKKDSEIPAIEIEVDGNRILKLNGVIDRVDKVIKDDGKLYVKIVDYKSSNKSLDINKIYEGLQLQLVMYMNAITEKNDTNPGGMFYFEVNEPKLLEEEKNKGEVSPEESLLRRMALNGMYDEKLSEDLNFAFIETVKGRSKETVKLLRDISQSESQNISEEDMRELLKYSKEVVKDIGDEMAKGNIEISPYKYGNSEDSCKFCPYGVVCDFENSNKEKLREIVKDDERAWEEIHNRVGDK